MIRQDLNKHEPATTGQQSLGSIRDEIPKELLVSQDGQLIGRRHGNERRPPSADHQVPLGKRRMGALMNILLSMYLGLIVLALTLLVFWVLSQFDPLS
jgi:hypothetical protein